MKIVIASISFLFLLTTESFSRSATDEFEICLKKIAVSTEMTSLEKVEYLDAYINKYPESEFTPTAKLIRGMNLLSDPFNIPEYKLESYFRNLVTQNQGKWESKMATFALLNVMHIDGKSQEVIAIGENMLTSNYFDFLEKENSDSFRIFRQYIPLNKNLMRNGVLQQLAIAYDHVGNTSRAAEIRSQASSALVSASSETTRQEPISTQQPTPSPVPAPVVSTLPEDKSSSWLLIVAGVVLAALAGTGLFWLLKKPSA